MPITANILIGLVALAHLFFLVLEMFLWTKPYGLKTFGITPELAAESTALAETRERQAGCVALAYCNRQPMSR